MLRLVLSLLFLILSLDVIAQNNSNGFISICYHDVKDEWDDDPMTVTTERLIKHFSWLKGHGYHPVSIQDIIDANQGKKRLPDKAVLLTFDDGYRNFYYKVYPVLKMFNYPAVFALVTSWMETPAGQKVKYGDQLKSRDSFLSWKQVNELMNSGLIEIASHSDNLHRGVIGNIQGNSQPAAVTRQYSSIDKHYEMDEAFQRRISQDLQLSSDVLLKRTGKRPRVIVWPYGAYSKEVNKIAQKKGMVIALGLDDSINKVQDISVINRHLINDNPSLSDFVYNLNHFSERDPIRVAHVDIDYIYDENPEQINKNLSKLLDRIKSMRINTVYLQAFSDPDGDGNTNSVYFPNRHLPVRSDLFNRVAWQLRTRANVSVYAWMPVLSFQVSSPDDWWVHEWKNRQAIISTNNYQRLSPFNMQAREFVAEIYQDLAKYTHFAGLLFHDDALLTDFEDASPVAVQKMAGMTNEQKLQAKINALTGFTEYLANKVRYYRPEIKTARNLYANVVMQPESSEWFAQTFSDFFEHYDYVAVMAMPYMENAEDPRQWLNTFVDKVKQQHPEALKKTVFELQTVDWRNQQKIPGHELRYQMGLLQRKNALNFGYYPDDFHVDQPPLSIVKEMMSLEVFPYGM